MRLIFIVLAFLVSIPYRMTAWSPEDAIRPKRSFFSIFAEKQETPALAGGRASAAEWGSPLIAAGPEDVFTGTLASFSPSVFGGYTWGNLFAGTRISGGAAFSGDEGLVLFVAGDVALEYARSEGSGSALKTAALACGIAGSTAFPWAVSARALAGDAAPVPRAELLAQAATPTIHFLTRSRVRAATGAGVAVEGSYSDMQIFARASIALDSRDYRGALAQGTAANLYGETTWKTSSGEIASRVRAGVFGAIRFDNFAGITGRITYSHGSEESDEWASSLRARTSAALIQSFTRLYAALEFPLLFARGNLFLSPNLPVEFFLKPYAEFLMAPPEGAAFFSKDGLFGGLGFEIAMTLDSERRDAFRFGAGLDLSDWMQGDMEIVDLGAMALFFAFSIVL